ncbi:MAG: phytanoyl-CoA dioxygenase family protein, partial [Gemmatimonadetes bacterium]|nr:phytanoyl-CoA dioxygenase family protein [Gemmatimonadota bacterium]
MHLNAAQVQSYRDQGYLVVPKVFAPNQAEAMIGHYMELRAQGSHPGDSGGTDDQPDDPNHTYPRMINMHDWDPASATWATRPDLLAAVEQLIDDEPVLRQTMLYFKPPGGRGQGLHQDEQYITINSLIGLWIALDPSDAAVGQMVVVPSSHGHLRPVEEADTRISFTRAQSQ